MPARDDPGYGDPLAPVGSAEWAKRWRLEFQNAVKRLPSATETNLSFYEIGERHRAWTLVTNEKGEPFKDFDSFCAAKQPYGLGTDPAVFRAHLAAVMGKKGADLATVSPGDDKGGRPAKGEVVEETCSPDEQVSSRRTTKDAALRAILRAPELVQSLYRADLLNQADAAKLGPKDPAPDKAARVAEVRQQLEKLDATPPDDPKQRPAFQRAFRKKAGEIVRAGLGSKAKPALEAAWGRATEQERCAFIEFLKREGVIA
jgi:hypothetical protein